MWIHLQIEQLSLNKIFNKMIQYNSEEKMTKKAALYFK